MGATYAAWHQDGDEDKMKECMFDMPMPKEEAGAYFWHTASYATTFAVSDTNANEDGAVWLTYRG